MLWPQGQSWVGMYQGGETALQADCGEFDSHPIHQIVFKKYD